MDGLTGKSISAEVPAGGRELSGNVPMVWISAPGLEEPLSLNSPTTVPEPGVVTPVNLGPNRLFASWPCARLRGESTPVAANAVGLARSAFTSVRLTAL